MSSDLYEELGLAKDAPQDQIRKAYKKKALQTHPDRLPPGATANEKADSEEKFRRVNNAYEVLSDPKKRIEYDLHGVWPPPEADEFPTSHMPSGSHFRSHSHHHHPSRSHTFPDPFFAHHHHSPFSAFNFTDPFTLFNSIFEDMGMHHRSSGHRHHSSRSSIRPVDPFQHMHRMQAEIEDFMDDIDRDPFSMRSGLPMFNPMSSMATFPALDHPSANDNRGRWLSESYMTSTVNGVTQTIHKRIDTDGNEHITRTLPDGRKVRTINGIEHRPRGFVPYTDPSKGRRLPQSSENRYLPPSDPRGLPMASTSRVDYGVPQSPTYSGPPPMYRDNAPPVGIHQRSRRSSDKHTYPSSASESPL
ncbi:hypothetical protein B0H34DRAFT_704170 [Crassisporium funariophilum]|nr:hypothetical protein B0H34DRAFT_704170 [Crassisporium funariophilum]